MENPNLSHSPEAQGCLGDRQAALDNEEGPAFEDRARVFPQGTEEGPAPFVSHAIKGGLIEIDRAVVQ